MDAARTAVAFVVALVALGLPSAIVGWLLRPSASKFGPTLLLIALALAAATATAGHYASGTQPGDYGQLDIVLGVVGSVIGFAIGYGARGRMLRRHAGKAHS